MLPGVSCHYAVKREGPREETVMIKRRWRLVLAGVGVFVSPGVVEPGQRMNALTLLTTNNQIFAATVCHDTPSRRGADACSWDMVREHGWPELRYAPRLTAQRPFNQYK